MTTPRITLEVMATSIDGVARAIAAGADRIELCQDMVAGGTTPSIGLVEQAVARCRPAGVDLMVMIRPRGGHFVYSDDEIAVMLSDIERITAVGVTGLVIGALTAEATVDVPTTRTLVAAASTRTTFHRAVDVSADVVSAAETAWDCGCDAVLSSGGATSALRGSEVLAALQRRAPDPDALIAAGGINADNVAQLVRETGVRQVHASARTAAATEAELTMPLGPAADWPFASWPVPDELVVRAMKGVLGRSQQ